MTADNEDLRSLIERGAELTSGYLRAGPGSTAGRPLLDEAITVLERAYGRIEPGETVRGQVAGQMGWLYGVRHLAHGGDPKDRTTAMHLLDESLLSPNPTPVLAAASKIILGQLLLAGATAAMSSPDAMMRMMRGGSQIDVSAADRAIILFREVADGPPISAETTSSARAMLTVAEALRGMLGGPGGMDLSKLGQALTAMQTLQQQMGGRGAGPVPPPMPDLSRLIPQQTAGPSPAYAERPEPDVRFDPGLVAVVAGPIPGDGPPPRPRPAPIPAPSAAELRTHLESQDSLTVDDRVALAAAAAEAPGSQPTDHLALAAALIARHHADGAGGWTDGPDDLQTAADRLDRIAPDLPDMTAEEVARALHIAAQLPGQAHLEQAFAEVATVMREAGIATLVYPGAALDAATGRLEPVSADARWSGRIAAVTPVRGDAAISHVRSAAQLVALIRRGRRPITEKAVFVANPRGDRETATMDALRLRRAFHPQSTGLGRTVEQHHGDGTPDEVKACLNAGLLHLGCGITGTGALELVGHTTLTPAEIAEPSTPDTPGGVAILPPDPAALTLLADALLNRGFSAVIGFAVPVPDRLASVIYWMLHTALVDDGASPAEAVAAVRAWLQDPHREPPELLSTEYRAVTETIDPAAPAYADALTCRGL
ncbi:hypothetical protein Ait01nite_082220 [Actinoplanes italicus]|uniref:hypothetical protein n=1 Tax=Actinoplanes italicus TaxID=113567 RepID=UPI000D05F876|nr:hypothetical protein [Actinoplanes italicus]GIE35177.1 hypothetical protein Ait01nite_082220 [Actinoplanes italicus]